MARTLLRTTLVVLLTGAVCLEVALRVTPVPDAFEAPAPSTRVLASDGTLLHETVSPSGTRGGTEALDALSPHVVAATLAGEDHRFFDHHGVDVAAVARAVWLNLSAGRVAFGGSTITQQLARLCLPGPRTLRQKLREMWWASVLERHWDKKRILAQYLSRAPYGGHLTGLSTAAQAYFGVPPSALSLGQASLLAVIPRAPRTYDPRTADGLERALTRRRHILDLLLERGTITADAHARALEEPVTLQAPHWPLRAPHAVMRVLREEPGNPRTITTTLDPAIQERAETLVTRTVEELGGRGVHQAAVLVVDATNGDVRAYVGSADFTAPREGQVDGVASPRSPGSTLKPLFYAAALDHGMTPATMLLDVARPFSAGRGQYLPRNFDGRQHGPVLLRDALANSYNLASVDLASRLGVSSLHSILARFDVMTVQQGNEDLGLGVILGGVDVTLWELSKAYLTLARGGVVTAPRLRVRQGKTAVENRRAVTETSARLITNILTDDVARARAFGRQGPLALPFEAAVKTGTSKDFRDNWAVGFTSRHLVAVWAGDFSGRSMTGVSGVTGAGLLWHRLMRSIHVQDPAPLPKPNAVKHAVCTLSGKTPSPHCPSVREEWFPPSEKPGGTCTMHQPGNVLRVEPALASWAVRAGLRVEVAVERPTILAPAPGEVFTRTSSRDDRALGVLLLAAGPAQQPLELLLDNTVVARGAGLLKASPPLTVGTHVLELRPNGERVQFTLEP